MNEKNNSLNVEKKDIIGYILSILVIFIHTTSFFYYQELSGNECMTDINLTLKIILKNTVSLGAVPLFFIISGAYFYRNYDNAMYISKVKTRFRSLVLPYLFWNIVMLLFNIVTSYSFISNYFVGREKFEINALNVFLAIFHHYGNNIFWYIFDLIIFVLIAPVINLIVKNKYIGMIVIVSIVILNGYGIGIPESIFFSQISIAFYIFGALIGKHYFKEFTAISTKKICIVSGVLIVVSCVYLFFVYIMNVPKEYSYIYTIMNTIVLFIIAIALWKVVDIFIDKLKRFNFMKESFLVYATHVNILAMSNKILYFIFPKVNYFAIPNLILSTMITLFVVHILNTILQKYCPKIYLIATGNR